MSRNGTKTSARRKAKPRAAQVVPMQRQRRRKYGQLPVPDARADLYWSTTQPELRGVTDAQLAKRVMDAPEFEQVLGSKLDAIDGRNRTLRGRTMGRPPRWNARHIEALLLYRRVTGTSTVKQTRERLSCDSEARLLLGFGQSIPSAQLVTRHLRENFDAEERRDLYRELDRQLRQRVIQLPGFDEECRKLGMDGSKHETRYTPPIPETDVRGKPTKRIRNAHLKPGQPGAITAPDAGIVGKGGGPKAGKGWQFLGLFSEHGTLVGWDISAIHTGEREAAERVLKHYEAEVLPHRDPKLISVCSADGGFRGPVVRRRLQELRIAPNIHQASHGDKEESLNNVAAKNASWTYFNHPSKRHYRNWGVNGHFELSCKCGQGTTERKFEVGKSGKLIIATRGSCQSCGKVTITADRWRKSKNPDKYVLAIDSDGDPAVGNSLTFNDPLATEYGKDRFGWNESIHATLNRRFGLLKPSWMRSKTQVETEFAIAASAISCLLLERHARQMATHGSTEAEEQAA